MDSASPRGPDSPCLIHERRPLVSHSIWKDKLGPERDSHGCPPWHFCFTRRRAPVSAGARSNNSNGQARRENTALLLLSPRMRALCAQLSALTWHPWLRCCCSLTTQAHIKPHEPLTDCFLHRQQLYTSYKQHSSWGDSTHSDLQLGVFAKLMMQYYEKQTTFNAQFLSYHVYHIA